MKHGDVVEFAWNGIKEMYYVKIDKFILSGTTLYIEPICWKVKNDNTVYYTGIFNVNECNHIRIVKNRKKTGL